VRSIVGPGSSALLCSVDGHTVSVAAAEGTHASLGASWSVSPGTAAKLLAAAGGEIALIGEPREDLRLGHEHQQAHVLALSIRGETHGLLIVTGSTSASLHDALSSLATQVSLALESADLTEEVHRRESEARFGSLVQHSSDLITVLDADATVVYQSPSIERILGYAPEEVVGTASTGCSIPRRRAACCTCSPTAPPTPAARRRSSSVRCATGTAACGSSKSYTPTCSRTRRCAASSSTAATCQSARPSRSSSPTRPSTTR
jgi:hypothetical protein